MTIHRHLTVGDFARYARLLARHVHRLPALLLKVRIIHDQHPIPFPGQRLHLREALVVQRYLISYHVCQQVIELLLVGLRYHHRQRVTVLERCVTEQAGDILTQGRGAGALGKVPATAPKTLPIPATALGVPAVSALVFRPCSCSWSPLMIDFLNFDKVVEYTPWAQH